MTKSAFWTERRAITVIIIVTAVLRLALAFRSEALIFTRYFQEDAYYLFNCAEHAAHGEGFTVDGIHPTNGVQPLIVVLYAPLFIFSGFDKVLALKFAFVYCALFDSLSVIFLFGLLKTLRKKSTEVTSRSVWLTPPVIAGAFWGTLFPIFVHTVSGLETGLYSTLLIASIYQYAVVLAKRKEAELIPAWRYICLGVTLGFVVLARIDGAIFVAMIALFELFFRKQGAITRAAVIALPALLISLPWWYYNYSTFGSLMPQSGISETLDRDIWTNVWQTLAVIADCVSVFFSLARMAAVPFLIYLGWFVGVMGICIFLGRRWKLLEYIKQTYSTDALLPLIAASVVLIIYYTFFFSAPYFISRYLQPLRIVTLIVAAMVIPLIVEQMLGSRPTKAILYVVAVAAVANTFLRYPPNFLTNDISTFYKVGKWAQTVPHSSVGMYQSGAAGFIAANVVNLDGKVNYDALQARRHGGIGSYLAAADITYVADEKDLVSGIVSSAEKYGVRYLLIDSIDRVRIYKRVQ
ncbi:MAG TPA: hypothetical protein VEW28_05795 [Candidatus Kapabacteria bacterium]|nr:hypothetical protein [Candidatus Kapabacteria bacterium]